MLIECPCKGCIPPKRSSICHSSCKAYLDWKKELDEQNRVINEKLRYERIADDDYHRVRKSRRKK